jgi:hypothetical protein
MILVRAIIQAGTFVYGGTMKLNIGKILTRSWEIIWKHKVLWIFGILAGFASGRSGGNSGGNRSGSSGDTNPFSGGQVGQMEGQFREFFQQYMLIIIAVCLVIFILSILFYALGMMGRIGMIKGVTKVESGAEKLVFGELWSESMPYFWRFFGLNFVISLAFAIIIIPLVLVGVLTAGIGFVCILPIICLLVPIGWAVGLILEQAQVAIVMEDLSMVDGFKRGWEILKSDVGGIIVLALILGVAGFIIGIIIALPIILAFLPMIFSLSSMQNSNSVPPTVWISLACCVIYFPVLLGLSGILTAYTKTAWVLSYLQLTKPAENENTPIVLQADA